MHVLLFLSLLATRGVIEATIQGTAQPLEVQLLRAGENDSWTKITTQSLASDARVVRFTDLDSGVYQIRIHGPQRSEVFATKIAVGGADTRRTTIRLEPTTLTGRITLGGTPLGEGAIILIHPDFDWRTAIPIEAGGNVHVPLWQRGKFRYTIQTRAMATPFASAIELAGPSPRFLVDIPDGRIRGLVRDERSNAPVANATVALESHIGDDEQQVRTKTDADGRFDFTGLQDGTHIVRVFPSDHLESAPQTFTLDRKTRLHELDVRLDPGRTVPVIVIDANDDPVENATLVVVSDRKIRARTKTDEDGRANVAVPADDDTTLFVLPSEGAFGVQRIARGELRGRVRVYLPPASSSLLIRARTTDGREMPPFSLLMRYNGELMPAEVADALGEVQGLRLATAGGGEALLRNIPAGSYEFWPYRTEDEAASIAAAADVAAAPIVVNVRTGENKIAVKFAGRR